MERERASLIRIGTAGWTIRPQHAPHFMEGQSVLARYATRFGAVEINSSFYRPHRTSTYERWAATVPPDFRFAVKVPKVITHELRLRDTDAALDSFLTEARGLGEKLGPLLFQLPPKFAFEAGIAREFFSTLRAQFAGAAVCEPRHASWFSTDAEALLRDFGIARAAADPARCPGADCAAGWDGLVYYRLHGSPRVYYTNYETPLLLDLAAKLGDIAGSGREAWCIFDNTALGHATPNALEIMEQVKIAV